MDQKDNSIMQEIEIKVKYTNCSQKEMEEYLIAHHYVCQHRTVQEDLYYNHPSRDFRTTDEALRIRTERLESGEATCYITYKGANQSHTGQSRLEIETAIADSAKTSQILQALGFIPVAVVHKDRTEFKKGTTTLCLDTLEGLGTYIEIEKLIPEKTTDSNNNLNSESATESQLLKLLQEFSFVHPVIETATYLELVMHQS